MEDNILERMGMAQSSPIEGQNVYLNDDNLDRRLFACSDVNISSRYHIQGSFDGRMSLPMMIVMLVLGFVTFFVNLGVIIRTIKILRHGHNNKPSFYYIGNLALSDLAIGLYIIITFLLHITNKSDLWQHKACTLQIAVAVTACQETIFTIMLISMDKYLYICHALKYRKIITTRRVYIALSSSWIISLIIGSLPAIGMHVKWDETCGICIFAQVISKDFAILFFVTAVVLPYAIIVSLYSILLYLAIKMQRAKYGGSFKTPDSSVPSNFRLTFMSRTPTGFSKSGNSTIKSNVSKTTISTTTSSASGVSVSKANRRRMRKQAMAEYKANLPDFNVADKSAKLIQGKGEKSSGKRNAEAKEIVHGKDGDVIHHLMKEEVLEKESTELTSGEELPLNSHGDKNRRLERGYSVDDSRNTITGKASENQENVDLVNTKDNKHNENGKSENVRRDVNAQKFQNEEVSVDAIPSEANNENKKGMKDIGLVSQEEKNDLPDETISSPKFKLTEKSKLRCASQTSSSDTDFSSTNLPSLNSTDDEDEVNHSDSSKKWSLSRYFNHVVSDTRDKVLFLKKCQAVKTVFLIVGSFTATYVPFVIGSLVYSLQTEKNKKLLHALQTLLYCAVVANSLANPLMYAYGYREFRIRTEKFKGIFAREKRPKI